MKNLCHGIILFLVLSGLSCAEDLPEFTNNWDEDVYHFGRELEDKHIDLFFKLSKSEFENDILQLRESTGIYTDEKIIIELTKILSKIGDSHTQLQLGNKFQVLPIEFLWLDDGILLSAVDAANPHHLGKKIDSVNDIPILEVINGFREVIAFENESNFKNQVIQYLKIYEFYQELGFNETGSDISLKFTDGSEYTIGPEPVEQLKITSSTTPLFLQSTDIYYWFEELEDEHLLYIQYNSCREISTLSFDTFTKQISAVIDENLEIDKVVLDLRHNGGGNSAIMKPLIDQLEDYVNADRLKKDNIYLIISRKTFSSALLNSFEIKERLENIVLGEPTGGKPNHYGEVRRFELPKSRLNVYYSTKYFTLVDDDPDSFEPDIFVEYNSEHFLNGIDPILQQIIEE